LAASFVLDGSVILASVLPDEHSAYADEVVARLAREQAVVPAHWTLEFANGLLVAVRRGRIGDADRRSYLRDVSTFPIEFDSDTAAKAWSDTSELARHHGLTAYDAAYLELARRRRLPLATLDRDLASAAEAEGVGTTLA
jgi:predicted nucleic acid-binding protein